MVKMSRSARQLEVNAPAYRLTYEADRPSLFRLETGTGVLVGDFHLASAVDADQRDEVRRPGPPEVIRHESGLRIVWPGQSTVWDAKRYELLCHDAGVDYRVSVSGSGTVRCCRYLHGLSAEDMARLDFGPSAFRAGYERPYRDLARGSRPAWPDYCTARPTAADRDLRPWWEDDEIDAVDDPARHGGLDSFLPGLWAEALEFGREQPWVIAGLAPEADQLQFDSFAFRGGARCGFELTYPLGVRVKTDWTSPALSFQFGARDSYHGWRTFVDRLETAGLVSFPQVEAPAWWSRPVLDLSGRDQAAAEAILRRVTRRGLDPGVVWLGSEWRQSEAEAWPDLDGFIAARRGEGREVVLSLPLWPDEVGRFWSADELAVLLEPAGLDAAGLRLTDPAPPAAGTPSELAGFEAVRAALRAVREAAGELRPDALVIAPTVNPYFAELVDMVPLGSLWSDRTVVEPTLRHRAVLARLCSPSWLLAVGDWHAPCLAAWREAATLAPQLGVPVLSQVEELTATHEALADDDLVDVITAWESYHG